jgi:hypothetical protein
VLHHDTMHQNITAAHEQCELSFAFNPGSQLDRECHSIDKSASPMIRVSFGDARLNLCGDLSSVLAGAGLTCRREPCIRTPEPSEHGSNSDHNTM